MTDSEKIDALKKLFEHQIQIYKKIKELHREKRAYAISTLGDFEKLLDILLDDDQTDVEGFIPPKLKFTDRGLGYFFNDENCEECTLQKSSLISDEHYVWLGREKNEEPHYVTGKQESPRMHLTQSQARWLGEKLIKFAETGELSDE